MPSSLDRSSVIVALTDGIGVQFGRASRKSFFQQLERLEGQEAFRRSPLNEQQVFVDLLAIASFYQSVIIPIRNSARFVSLLHSAGATHLRVGSDKLGQRYANRATTTTDAFSRTLSLLEIPEHMLTYSTLSQFIIAARRFMKERQ